MQEEKTIIHLERTLFAPDGNLDTLGITIGSLIPLRNDAGQLFRAKVLSINESTVELELTPMHRGGCRGGCHGGGSCNGEGGCHGDGSCHEHAHEHAHEHID